MLAVLLHAGTAGLLRGQLYRVNKRRDYQHLFTDSLVSLGLALGGSFVYFTILAVGGPFPGGGVAGISRLRLLGAAFPKSAAAE